MLATSGGFVAICPKKEVELGADKLIHRADHAEELRQEIEFPCSKAVTNEYAYLCGGALRAINPNSSMTMGQVDTCAAVFKGNLFNKAELALQVVGCPPHVNEAQLLLHLYASLGLDMLGRLQGQYAFCLYDSKQARVFAARDHSGAVPLVEGRTAAGSLIIACGTFLPEGVHQMVDIQPGEYKYGWHALPRQFKCGATKIVSGRASCDYGIRRRSVDAFNAPQGGPLRHQSLDIPSRSHGHGGSHTPGRYVPPHAAGGYQGRQRAMSLDSGHWGAPPHPPSGTSLPSPHGSHFTNRRRSENNHHGSNSSSHNKPHQQQQQPQQHQQHHAAKAVPSHGAGAAAAAAAAAAMSPAAAAAKAAAAALAVAAASTAPPAAGTAAPKVGELQVCIPAAAAHTPASPTSEDGAQEASTPMSAGTDGASPHRRKRRHRSRKHKAHSPAAGGGVDAGGASSDTESQVSTSTHDSANSAPASSGVPVAAAAAPAAQKASPGAAAAANRAAAGQHKPAAAGASRSKAAAAAPAKVAQHSKPAAAAAAGHAAEKPHGRPHSHQANHKTHQQQQQQQQWQPKTKQQQQQPKQQASEQRRSSSGSGSGGGFKRNGSCGELAALGSSPTPRSVLQVPPHGLAC